MPFTQKLTLCFGLMGIMFFGYVGWPPVVSVEATYTPETTVGELGGPLEQEQYLVLLKDELARIYQEQSMLSLTHDLLQTQLESLSSRVAQNDDWSNDVLDRVYKGKIRLSEVQDRQHSVQAEFNDLYRSYLYAGGVPLASVGTVVDEAEESDGGSRLMWPILPEKGISAYFLDKTYHRRFGINHLAIDIPTPQWTVIRAPADGVVADVSNAGFGYSTLILDHEDMQTAYGHVAQFLVARGEFVKQGDPIALSGGRPGTQGAGHVTTGPHLHFEVLVNGYRKNPLYYLPPFKWVGSKVVVQGN